MSINSIVIVREVWDTRDLTGSVLDESGSLKDSLLATRMEPEDLNALEAALRIKDEQGGTVTALSVGAPRGVDVLRECLYRGADAALRVDADPRLLDTQGTAALLAKAVEKIGDAKLILSGVTVCDGENSLLGSNLAAQLGIAQASYVDGITALSDDRVVAKRAIEMGYEDVALPLPALITLGVALTEDDPRAPRSAKAMLKLKAKKAVIPTMTPDELGVDPAAAATTERLSLEAVPERVIQSQEVDAEDESALRAMLDAVLKGD